MCGHGGDRVGPRFRDAITAYVRYETRWRPDPAWAETYARMQPVFDRLYFHSQALYDDLDALVGSQRGANDGT